MWGINAILLLEKGDSQQTNINNMLSDNELHYEEINWDMWQAR